ncbi:MAG TPA: glycosyltransferase family 2 protein [Caldimonas sp.]|nr:glycosyltransferase family 2 protein [Caldimonas sp.]HEX4234096.1 glycosyltransferase family 2 protein [Caldimonas sp.]
MSETSDVPSAAPARRDRVPAISCVLPAFNEGESLPALLTQLTEELRQHSDDWEIIVVNDGSNDDTEIAMLPWLRGRGVRYVSLSRNFGKEAALTAGLDRARGDVVLLMDADLQHSPALIAEMVVAWRAGADMVYTVRTTRGDESFLKTLGTRIFYRIVNAGSAVDIPANAGDFRLLDRSVVDALNSLPERNRFMKGLYAWVGFRSVAVDYVPDERFAGESSYSMRRLSRLALTGVTAFTNTPLRLWSALGALIAVGALLGGAWFIVEHYTFGTDVPGWATLSVSMMFFSGVQLLSIGILGEYVGRIFDEVKQRPVYLVRHDSGPSDATAAPLP